MDLKRSNNEDQLKRVSTLSNELKEDHLENWKFLNEYLKDGNGIINYTSFDIIIDIIKLRSGRKDGLDSFMNYLKENDLDESSKLKDDYIENWDFLNEHLSDLTGYLSYTNLDRIIDDIKLYSGKQDDLDSFMNYLKENDLDKSSDILSYYYHYLGYIYFDNADIDTKVEDVIKKFKEVNKDYPQNNTYFQAFLIGSIRVIRNKLDDIKYDKDLVHSKKDGFDFEKVESEEDIIEDKNKSQKML